MFPSIKRTARDKPYDPSATCHIDGKVLKLDRWDKITRRLIIAPIDTMGAFSSLWIINTRRKGIRCLRFMNSVIGIRKVD